MRPSGSLEIEGEQKQPQVFEEADPRGDEAASSGVPHNPWLLRCDRDQLTRLAAGALSSGGGGASSHDSTPPQSEAGSGREQAGRAEGGGEAAGRGEPPCRGETESAAERDLKKLHICLLIQDIHLVIGRDPFDVERRAQAELKELSKRELSHHHLM